MGKRYEVRRIHGTEHKLCRGPTHQDPTWLPLNQFRPRSAKARGALRSWCNRCEGWHRNGSAPEVSGYMPIKRIYFAIEELDRRLGHMEAARRVGVSKTTWYRWRHGAKKIQRQSAAKVLRVLAVVRSGNEVRSKRDILRGRKARGEKETPPPFWDREAFYNRSFDSENLGRQRKRAADNHVD